jgi:hypothetical protein
MITKKNITALLLFILFAIAWWWISTSEFEDPKIYMSLAAVDIFGYLFLTKINQTYND